jgi:CHASE3 domain sensor protein
MESERKEELLRIIKDGSQRKLRKVKKEDLLDLIDDVLTDEDSDKSRLLEEIQDLREQISKKDEIIKEHEDSDKLVEEYRGLVQEIREKYTKTLDQNLANEKALTKMTRTAELLRRLIFGLGGLWILILILIAIL